MGEWRRIFLDKSRIILFILITVLSLLTFISTLSGGFSVNSLNNMLTAAKYRRGLHEAWSDLNNEELADAINSERELLTDYGLLINNLTFPRDASRQDIKQLAEHFPDLAARSENVNDFNYLYGQYLKSLNELSDEIDHLRGYSAYLSGISEQAKIRSQVSVFGKSGSFSSRNLQKTAEDFKNLDGIILEFGNNSGLEKWLDFGISDYFFLALLTVIILAFSDERKAGLWSVVRSCKCGRSRLGIHRLAILFAGTFAAAVLIYLIPLIVSLLINGGFESLDRPLQSLISFKTSTLRISIFQWILRFFALKILAGFAVGLLLWCILGTVTNPQFSLSVLGAVLAAEYILYRFLPVQSVFNILKYFNIFSYIRTSDLYTDYLNINLFGFPVGVRDLMLAALPILIFILITWSLLIQTKRRPEGNKDYLSKLSDIKNRALDAFRAHLTIGGWEIYKSLIYEFGAVIIVLIVILTASLNYSVGIYEADSYYRLYLVDAAGKIDENSDLYFERAEKNIPSGSDGARILSSLNR